MTEDIKRRIREFVTARDWDQFHNPKDLAIALSIEASELLENFLWKDSGDADRERIRHELADILIYSVMLAGKYGFDVEEIMAEKIAMNEEKYPVEKARGRSTKYNRY